MPSFFNKLKGAFSSPSPSRKQQQSPTSNSSFLPQIYAVKEKDLPKLHLAAWKGDINKVTELCRPDKINLIDKEGRSPLHLAIFGNHLEVVEHLLNEGARLNVPDRDSRSPFILACLKGNPQMMKLLLKNYEHKNLINMHDQAGLNPLLYAVKNENLPILNVLLEVKDLNLEYQDKDKNTALHYSVIQRNYKLIDILVDNGADIDVQNADGLTPLMLTAQNGDEELADYLLDYDADKTIKDKFGKTALSIAESNGHTRCAQLFKENRPVKKNSSKKRETMDRNEISGTEAPSTSDKKFENMFAGKTATAGSTDPSSKYKPTNFDAQSNTSKLDEDKMALSYNKSDKLDSWENSDDENNDDSFENSHIAATATATPGGVSNLKKIVAEGDNKKFDTLFGKADLTHSKEIDSNIDININEDKLYSHNDWVFQPSGQDNQRTSERPYSESNSNSQSQSSEFHVLTSFFPGSAKNKGKELQKQTSQTSINSNGNSNWTIFTYTSNVKGAGTDANVYLQIYGTKANSAQFFLENKNVKDLFESGKCDRFDKNLPDIGKPTKIKIGHDNKGSFAGWHLDKVVLQNNITNEKHIFPCGRWLAKDELDHRIELELTPESNTMNKNKMRESSTSSWSTEDDDSSSNQAVNRLSPVKQAISLKQIDEEKLNETTQSKINSKKSMDKPQQGPPQISDFDDSSIEEPVVKNLNSTKKSDQTSINLTNVTPQMPTFDKDGSAISYLVKNVMNKQNSTNSSDPSVKSPSLKSNNDTIGKLIQSTASTTKKASDSTGSALLDMWKNDQNNKNNNNNNKVNFEFSDNEDDKSDSIKDFIEEFDSIHKPDKNKSPAKKPMSPGSSSGENSSIRFLIENNIVPTTKKNETIGKLFNPEAKKDDVPGLKDLIKKEAQNKKKQQDDKDKDSIDVFLDDLVSEPIKKETKKPQDEVLGLKDMIRKEAQNKNRVDRDSIDTFSDTNTTTSENKNINKQINKDPSKEILGLTDLIKLDKQKNQDSITDSIDAINRDFTKNETIGKLVNKNFERDSNDSFGEEKKNSTISKLVKMSTQKTVDRDPFDDLFGDPKSESVDDLEKEFNQVLNPESKKPKSPRKSASSSKSALGFLAESMPPPGFRNEPNMNNESFILHESPKLGKNFEANNSPNRKDSDSVDSLTSQRNSFKGGSVLNNLIFSNQKKSVEFEDEVGKKPSKGGNVLGNLILANPKKSDDFDDFDDDESESVGPANKKLIETGTIDKGIGAFMSNFKDSPISSPTKNSTKSFMDIIGEMYDDKQTKLSDAETRDLLNKLKEKNELLEKSKRDLNNQLSEREAQLEQIEKSKLDLHNQLIEKEAQLQKTEKTKKDFEKSFKNLSQELAEKEKQINLMMDEKSKAELANNPNDLKALKKEISDLKEEKASLESKLSTLQTTAAVAAATVNPVNNSSRSNDEAKLKTQNESLSIQVKALENQIEEVNKDRKELSAHKEELIQKLDETNNDIRKRDEALQIVTLQFNVEKKALNDEITKHKKDLQDINEVKKKLEIEIDNIKKQLNEKSLSYEKLNIEKINFEKQLDRERSDHERMRKNFEIELNTLKEEKIRLTEKLASAETRLLSTEKDAKYTTNQIDDKQKMIDDLKEQLIKTKAEFSLQLNLFKKEKEEKENLLIKLDSMESTIKKNMEEISELKLNRSHDDSLDRIHPNTLKSPSPQFYQPEYNNKNSQFNSPVRDIKVENENKKLHDDVKQLSEKLFKTESELEKLKLNSTMNNQSPNKEMERNQKSNLDNTRMSYMNEDLNMSENNHFNNSRLNANSNENDKIQSEIQKLRQDFNVIMNKYSNLENSNYELNESINSLRNQAFNVSASNPNRSEINRREPVDVTGLITEVPLKTLTTLNSYLIQNIIAKEEQNNLNDSLNKSTHNFNHINDNNINNNKLNSKPVEPSQILLNHSVRNLSCPKCAKFQTTPETNSYSDLLKYELSKRIELQIARELSLSGGFDFSFNKKFNNINNTGNFDSLYNSTSKNSRYIASLHNTNSDLLTSLRSKFLI